MSKYVYVNIRLPIKVSDDLSVFDIFSDQMTIDFEACPELSDNNECADENLLDKLRSLNMLDDIKSNLFEAGCQDAEELRISKNDFLIKSRKKRENLTFRAIHRKSKMQTKKRFSLIN